MLAFHRESTNSWYNVSQEILRIFMLARLLSVSSFVSWKTKGRHNQYYMLAFPLLWVFTFEDYYSSMTDKYTTFYVRSSYLSQHFNLPIHIIKRWKKLPTLYVGFLLEKHQFTIKVFTRDIFDVYVSTFATFQKS